MNDSPIYKAYRLSMVEADPTAPDGRLSLHYLAMATDAEAAIEAVKAARGRPCEVSVIDDSDGSAAIAKRLRLGSGQVTAL